MNLHSFIADPDPDPVVFLNLDPDPDPALHNCGVTLNFVLKILYEDFALIDPTINTTIVLLVPSLIEFVFKFKKKITIINNFHLFLKICILLFFPPGCV